MRNLGASCVNCPPNRRSMLRVGHFLMCFVLVVGLGSCNAGATPTATISPAGQQETTATAVLPIAASDTPVASPVPQRSLVVLLAPPGSDTEDMLALQQALSELATQDGLRFETRETLTDIDLGSEVRILVVMPPDPGVVNLAAANPEVQVLAMGVPGVQAAQNLSVIGTEGERADQQGFLAGYLAALVSPDWRVGVVSRADTVEGKAARNGFVNGVIFYCGLCRPAYPPFLQYPITVDLPGGAGETEQQAAADAMTRSAVKTVYVYPGAGDLTLLNLLAQAGINLIGGAEPPAEFQSKWVASIFVDPIGALQEIWPRLLAGEEGISVGVPLVVGDRNEALFSVGRQRLVDELLQNLLAGFIDPGVNLENGEPR